MAAHNVFGNHAHGRQAARAYDFTALNLAGLCKVIPYAHERVCIDELPASNLPNEGKRLYHNPSQCLLRAVFVLNADTNPRTPDQ